MHDPRFIVDNWNRPEYFIFRWKFLAGFRHRINGSKRFSAARLSGWGNVQSNVWMKRQQYQKLFEIGSFSGPFRVCFFPPPPLDVRSRLWQTLIFIIRGGFYYFFAFNIGVCFVSEPFVLVELTKCAWDTCIN